MTRRLAVALIAAALLLSGPIHALPKQSFSSGTLGVRVDVLVTDGRNPVAGLTAPDFELRDNGVLQTIDLVDSFDLPINAVLALDSSASMQGKRQADLIAASQALLDGLKPADRAALTTFSHAVSQRIALTSDLPAVRRDLGRIEPSGETAIMDGAYVALTATLAQTGRSLLVSAKPSDDPFVGTWYHATTAFMLQKGLYGEAVTHLERVAAVLPDEARALFDRASYLEIQGLPVNQVLLSDEDILALKTQRSGRRPLRLIANHAGELGIPLSLIHISEPTRLG